MLEVKYEYIDPYNFCMECENRSNLLQSGKLKAIEPYE